MKSFFLSIWALLSLPLGGLLGLHAWRELSWGNVFALFLLLYCAFCSLRLILAAYRPWGSLGRNRTGNWLCLLLLPLTLLPLHVAYRIWQQGIYIPGVHRGRHRITFELGQMGLSWLQDLVGFMGPVLALAALGILGASFLLNLYWRR
jgi:hypothetical protein